ncbi:MAG: metalloenzyme [Acidobacteriota bacterium]
MAQENSTALPARGRVLFVFVDGIGVAEASAHNPFSLASTPAFEELLGGRLVASTPIFAERDHVYRHLDARLGVPGLPQSATGQTALFAGANGAAALGRHVTAFPGATLQALIREGSLFLRAQEGGLRWVFANVRTKFYFEALAERRLRRSVTAWAVEAAGGAYRDERDLLAGRAVSWDIVRDRIDLESDAPPITASEAGRHLGRLCEDSDLVVYETFLTDFAGHRRFGLDPVEVVERVDGLLAGVIESLPGDITLVLTSDHGNLEDLSTKGHTAAPVPLLARGPGAAHFSEAEGLLDVYPGVLRCLGLDARVAG